MDLCLHLASHYLVHNTCKTTCPIASALVCSSTLWSPIYTGLRPSFSLPRRLVMGLSCFLGLDFVASSTPLCGVGAGSVGVAAATQSLLGMCLIFGGVDVHACTQSNTPSILFRRPTTLISFLIQKRANRQASAHIRVLLSTKWFVRAPILRIVIQVFRVAIITNVNIKRWRILDIRIQQICYACSLVVVLV